MHHQKLGISLYRTYALPILEVVKMIKAVGFDAISPSWREVNELKEVVDAAREAGLEIQSLHAPFNTAALLWRASVEADAAVEELIGVIDACASLAIPVVVMHVWIGFDDSQKVAPTHFANYDRLVAHAHEKGVKIAFENTEGEEYLFALLARYRDNDAVGFCWDAGHEMCYNRGKDLLAMFGEQLIMTHLNDNLGISSPEGKIHWTDDLHLLPFDGMADWAYNAERLKDARPIEILNFELNIASKPNRHENDAYGQMPLAEYFADAYKRAVEIGKLYQQ